MVYRRDPLPRFLRLPWGEYIDPKRVLAVTVRDAWGEVGGQKRPAVILEIQGGGTLAVLGPAKDLYVVEETLDKIIHDLERWSR